MTHVSLKGPAGSEGSTGVSGRPGRKVIKIRLMTLRPHNYPKDFETVMNGVEIIWEMMIAVLSRDSVRILSGPLI